MDNEKIFELLDDIRECTTCSDNSNCKEFLFSKLSEEKILKETGLEESFLARLLARSLSWMAVEETSMMYLIDESGIVSKDDGPPPPPPDFDDGDMADAFDDDFDFNPDLMNYSNPVIHHLNDTRQQMRDTIKMLLDMRNEMPGAAK